MSKDERAIFLGISLRAAQIFAVSVKSAHLDSTSFHLHGKYEEDSLLPTEPDETVAEPTAIELTYGN